jgi:hypothetical protein
LNVLDSKIAKNIPEDALFPKALHSNLKEIIETNYVFIKNKALIENEKVEEVE